MRKSKTITLLLSPILSAILLTSCGESESEPIQRDAYQSMEECLKDWNTQELCGRMEDQDEREYHSNHGVGYPIFWGPGYYGSSRSVHYQGRDISPMTRSSSIPPYATSSRSSSASRTGVSTPRSTSMGGFGSKGISSGS